MVGIEPGTNPPRITRGDEEHLSLSLAYEVATVTVVPERVRMHRLSGFWQRDWHRKRSSWLCASFDQVRVDLFDAETDAFIASRLTDGSGWFGFVNLAPGRYKAIVDNARVTGRHVAVTSLVAGQLSTVADAVRAALGGRRAADRRDGHNCAPLCAPL